MRVEYVQTGIVSLENGNVLVDGNTLQSAILEFPSKFEDGKKTFPGTVKIVVEDLTSSGKFSTEKDGDTQLLKEFKAATVDWFFSGGQWEKMKEENDNGKS